MLFRYILCRLVSMCVYTLKTGWVQVELCREVAVTFLLVANGALSVHHGKISAPGLLPLEGMGHVVVYV